MKPNEERGVMDRLGNDMKLNKDWKQICDEYVRQFCKKHGYDIEWDLKNDLVWVRNDPGTIACVGDMFVDMEDIRYDIDNDIPEDKYEEWYWTSMSRCDYDIPYMNYKSFCQGCPDPVSKDQVKKIMQLHKNVEDAKQALQGCLDDIKNHKKNEKV